MLGIRRPVLRPVRGRGDKRRRLPRGLSASLAIALLAGSAQAAGAWAADPGVAARGATPPAAGTLAQAASPTAARDDNGATASKARRCRPRQVRAGAGAVRLISIRCRLRNRARAHRVNRRRARVIRAPKGGRIVRINQRHDLVRYRPRAGFSGRDRFVVIRRYHGRRWRTVVRVRVRGVAPLSCERQAVTTNYQTPVRISVACSGEGIAPLALASPPSHGALVAVGRGGDGARRTLTATYVPNQLYVGGDTLLVEARGSGGHAYGAATIEVRLWRMRALGDSATAGFGFLGDGTEIIPEQIGKCAPPTPVNNRCSSNSDGGLGYEGPTSWSADFGLSNDVSWAAQFANGWQGGGHISAPRMFQNRAVTGSTPADWLPGGALHGQMQAIVADNPDLIAFTLGVNPLLGEILEEGKAKACFEESASVAALVACIQPLFVNNRVLERLRAVYTLLLAAPDAEVVTFQYHLSYPFLAVLGEIQAWQVEALVDHLNSQIATAVADVKAALPAAASRLTLVEARVDPGDPDPLKVPRFNLGVPPNPNQTWTASFECPPPGGFTVDGPSHQSEVMQAALPGIFENKFCAGDPWTISADTGIHPNREGYAQFAAAMTNVAVALGLVPQLP